MAFTIAYQFLAIDKFTRVGAKIANSFRSVERQVNRTHQATKRLAKSFENIRSIGAQTFVGLSLPMAGIAAFAFKAQSQLETLQITFESALQSTEKAKLMVQDLVHFAATTPFRMQGVIETGRMLLGFGLKQNEVMERMTKLGDVAAGTGRPMKDLAFVFGQVKAKGRLLAEEINQFAERGLPLLEILAKGTGRTKKEILDFASKGAISFELFQKAFDKMHELRYQDNMVKLSQSLGGLWSTLLDTFQIAAAGFFERLDKMFDIKGKMRSLISILQGASKAFNKFVDTNPELSRMLFIFAAILAIIPPLLVAIGVLGLVATLASKGLGLLAAGFAVIFSPVTLFIAAIAAIGVALFMFRKNLDKIRTAVNTWANEVFNSFVNKFNELKAFVTEFATNFFKLMFAPIIAAFGVFSAILNGEYDKIMDALCKPFKDAFDIIISIFEQAKSVYQSFVDLVSAKTTAGVDVTQTQVFKQTMGGGGPAFTSPTYGPMGGAQLGANSRTDVNVNLNGPKGTVDSVSTKQFGFNNSTVGTNVEEY